MKTQRNGLVIWAVFIATLCCWAPAALAYYPPCRDVQATWQSDPPNNYYSGYISYNVIDPILQMNMPGRSCNYSWHNSSDLKVVDGIVIAQASYNGDASGRFIYVSVYDPGRQKWMDKIIDNFKNTTDYVDFNNDLKCADGVVVFKTYQEKESWALTYDPQVGEWKEFYFGVFDGQIDTKVGVVLCAKGGIDLLGPNFTGHFIIYDPRDNGWHYDGTWFRDLNLPDQVHIELEPSGTVYFCGNEIRNWGYDTESRMWVEGGYTQTLSHFLITPSVGGAPLQFCLTDLSFGAISFKWELNYSIFNTTDRSFFYTINSPGTYDVSQIVDAPPAYAAVGCDTSSQSVYVQDVTPPEGGILINGGAQYTNSTLVTVSISINGTEPGAQMRFANGDYSLPSEADWSGWEALTDKKQFSLWNVDGYRYVWAQFKDAAGNTSTPRYAQILLDTTPPVVSMAINSGAAYTRTGNVTLTMSANDWGSGFGSGAASVRFANMFYDAFSQQWAVVEDSWTPWQPIGNPGENYTIVNKSWTLPEGDGLKKVAGMARDAAGVISPLCTAGITVESIAPINYSISINGGATYTNDPNATVTVDAGGQDTSGIKMQLGKWGISGIVWNLLKIPVAPVQANLANYPISPGLSPDHSSNCLIYARFFDAAGNPSDMVFDGIILDTTPPVDGTVTATGGDKQVTLDWSGFSDALSGIKSYKVYNVIGQKELLIYQGWPPFTHSNLKKGATYTYKVVALDKAGNVSAGATAQGRTKSTPLPFLILLLD